MKQDLIISNEFNTQTELITQIQKTFPYYFTSSLATRIFSHMRAIFHSFNQTFEVKTKKKKFSNLIQDSFHSWEIKFQDENENLLFVYFLAMYRVCCN